MTDTDPRTVAHQTLMDAVSNYIQVHNPEENDATIVTAFVLRAAYTSPDLMNRGATRYTNAYSENLDAHTAVGLAQQHFQQLQWEMQMAWEGNDPYDD